jgi:hypothetical protein
MSGRNLKHGYKTKEKTYPEYAAWSSMIQRCENPNHKSFKRYGGRGISVCKSWRSDFQNFLLDMGNKPSKNHSIDRIDNNIGYCPENCTWATDKKQNLNKENTVWLIFMGKKIHIEEYAEVKGISYQAACKRIQRARKSATGTKVILLDGTVVLRNKGDETCDS